MVFDHPGSKAPTMSRWIRSHSTLRIFHSWYRLSLLESPNTSSVRTPKSTARGRMRSKLLFTFRDDNRYALSKLFVPCTYSRSSLLPIVYILSPAIRPTLCASPLKGDEEPANINPFTPAPSVLRARYVLTVGAQLNFNGNDNQIPLFVVATL